MLKTCWVEPGEGATVGELVGAMGGLPPGFAAGGTRTSLAIVGEGKVMFDAYDRIRAIEALERVGVRVGERNEIVVAGIGTVTVVANTVRPIPQPQPVPLPQWPELAEKLLAAAQEVCSDVRGNSGLEVYRGGFEDQSGSWVVCDKEIFDWLMEVVAEIHNEAVEVVERERSRNR